VYLHSQTQQCIFCLSGY